MTRAPRPFLGLVIAAGLLAAAVPAQAARNPFLPPVEYVLTTDLLGLSQGDLQAEFTSVIAPNTSWSIRVGYMKYRQASSREYANGKGRWEVGFRWRAFLLQRAPHWLFLGLGWNNRPYDAQITPLAEAGFCLNVWKLSATAVGFYGYEFYVQKRAEFQNAWVRGFELRVGFCF